MQGLSCGKSVNSDSGRSSVSSDCSVSSVSRVTGISSVSNESKVSSESIESIVSTVSIEISVKVVWAVYVAMQPPSLITFYLILIFHDNLLISLSAFISEFIAKPYLSSNFSEPALSRTEYEVR